jgi:branched-chain amino acid transport system substrate-binding protein
MEERIVGRTSNFIATTLAAISIVAVPSFAADNKPKEQYFPIITFKTGAAAPLGIATFYGYVDYWEMLNKRDGGVNGVKIVWDECEGERKVDKGVECYEKLKLRNGEGATAYSPGATDLTYALLKRATGDKIPLMTQGYGRTDTSDGSVFPYVFPIGTNYWSQSTAKIKYIGMRLGGMDKLAGKKIVNLYHGSGYGKETMEILDIQAKKYGFQVIHIEVPLPGTEQDEQWKKIVEIKPDWVILRGIGVMNPVALKTARKYGWPAARILGVWWAGAEADVVPAGDAARGFITTAFTLPGREFPVVRDILKYVYGPGSNNGFNPAGVGDTYYNRGLSASMLMIEAMRAAQAHFGNRPITGEEMRWGVENMHLTDRRISDIGAFGLLQPLHLSCANHEGGGAVRFQRWNGKEWTPITGWIQSDQEMVRPLIEKSAHDYATKEHVALRDCKKEDAGRQLYTRY